MVKNILHLSPFLGGGGAERQLALIAVEQSMRGYNVHVGIRFGGGYENLLIRSGVKIHKLEVSKTYNPLLLARVDALVKKVRPDVIQTWLPQMDFFGGLAALWNSVSWVASERSNGVVYERFSFRKLVRFCLIKHACGIVANSSSAAEYWRMKVSPNVLITKISNAVDVTAIRNAAQVSGGYSISDDSIKDILVVGRLMPSKGIENVIEAVSRVPQKYNSHVKIIGNGPLRNKLMAKIREDGLDNRITLLANDKFWWRFLKKSKMLISMSHFEGQPNVVLEAMAAGCPLIVSEIPAHREFLDEDSAIILPLNRPDLLADAIISVISDPVSACKRADRAALYVEGLTTARAVDAYDLVYEKVVRK
jgi:glycosyltransferase involved in cell wall biosynthesis